MDVPYLNDEEAGDVVNDIIWIMEEQLLVPLRIDVPLDHEGLGGLLAAAQEDRAFMVGIQVRITPSELKVEAGQAALNHIVQRQVLAVSDIAPHPPCEAWRLSWKCVLVSHCLLRRTSLAICHTIKLANIVTHKLDGHSSSSNHSILSCVLLAPRELKLLPDANTVDINELGHHGSDLDLAGTELLGLPEYLLVRHVFDAIRDKECPENEPGILLQALFMYGQVELVLGEDWEANSF